MKIIRKSYFIFFAFFITSCGYIQDRVNKAIKNNAEPSPNQLNLNIYCTNNFPNFSYDFEESESIIDINSKIQIKNEITHFNSNYKLINSNNDYFLSITANKEASVDGGDGGVAFSINPETLRGKTITYGAFTRASSENKNDQTLGIFDGEKVVYGQILSKDSQWQWSLVKKYIPKDANQVLLYNYAIKGLAGSQSDKLDIKSPRLFMLCD
tara:strand:+ start:858 stop:1490 length:633 start_codon:yes stop_codon:yes gene_type:complete